MPKVAVYTEGRKLSDGKLYILSVYDCDFAGLLVRAYHQLDAIEYTLSPTNPELKVAGIKRDRESYKILASSIDIKTEKDKTFLTSNLGPLKKPKFIPQGDEAREFINSSKAGAETLPDLLVRGLSDLARSKPVGLLAVKQLGEWLLANNPNQPQVAMED
jgi:hypothetical protein